MKAAIGLGCMRLSDASVERARAIATILAASEAGITLLDTADVYSPNEAEIGHNEHLVAEALASLPNGSTRPRIATKGGLVREGGRWRPDGRAKHLVAACERSLAALGVARVDLYLLHAVDPRVAIETSARALASIEKAGLARAVGLCNVTLAELDRASRVAPIAAVQVRAGPNGDEALRSGVAKACLARGLLWMAHTPFGSARGVTKLARDVGLSDEAAKYGVNAAEIALARLMASGAMPLPGATRPETARSCGKAIELASKLGDRTTHSLVREVAPEIGRSDRERDVVMILGGPASGKSTLAKDFVARGYARLNRDERGGRLDDLAGALDAQLSEGMERVVLDNTYPSRISRSRVVEIAARHGAKVRCIWMDTSIEDAQVNACIRLVERHGVLPMPEEIAKNARVDPVYLGPGALFRARRAFEPPALEEGFASIDRQRFNRVAESHGHAGALIDAAFVWRSQSGAAKPIDANDVALQPGRAEQLRSLAGEGRKLVGVAWLPDSPTDDRRLTRLNELLGLEIAWAACSHPGGPPICWCRPPLPGLVVALLRAHEIAASRCVAFGNEAFSASRSAKTIGIESVDPDTFFRVE